MSAFESPQHIPTTGTPYIRVALVTGAAHGIGRAIALHLAADGLDVALNDLATNTAQLDALVHEIEKLGRRAVAVTADVASEDAVRAMVESAVAALGRLDVMVANAGVGANGAQSVMEASVENWEKCWQVNIRGVLLCYKYAARQMVKQGDGGRIIGASSICGVRGYAGIGGYCISKAAVRSLTQTTALELREYNITVNAYAPGVIETNMTAHEADKDHSPGFTLKQFFKIPDFRTGQPSDVAAVVSFLASPGSQFVTGQTISVDDGVHFS
ncbi:hypothetical protein B0H11DRAFT_2280378 [Mycena galericulata]|nr:hypothetical protein B0H11DRAFT_2280378 [Mycena galericulata]